MKFCHTLCDRRRDMPSRVLCTWQGSPGKYMWTKGAALGTGSWTGSGVSDCPQ